MSSLLPAKEPGEARMKLQETVPVFNLDLPPSLLPYSFFFPPEPDFKNKKIRNKKATFKEITSEVIGLCHLSPSRASM